MRKLLLFLLISLFAAIALAGCLAYVPGPPPMDGVYAPGPPPEPVVEVVPAIPYPGAVWLGGYWGYGGRRLGLEPGLLGTPSSAWRGLGAGLLAPYRSAGMGLAAGLLAIRSFGEMPGFRPTRNGRRPGAAPDPLPGQTPGRG